MKAQAHREFSGSVTGLAGLGSLFRRALRHWNDKRMVTAMSGLDDYLLADIGLTRSDLDWALHQPGAALHAEGHAIFRGLDAFLRFHRGVRSAAGADAVHNVADIGDRGVVLLLRRRAAVNRLRDYADDQHQES